MSSEFHAQFIADFSKLLESGKDYDLVLYAGEGQSRQQFNVHKLILSSRSDYFQAALSSNWLKKQGEYYVFEKSNIDGDVFKVLLRYFYTGKVNVNSIGEEKLLELLYACDELGLTELIPFIQDHFITTKPKFICENAGYVFKSIFKFASCEKLKDVCLRAIILDPTKLFFSQSYLELDVDTIIMILKKKLSINELELWRHIITWGRAQHPNLKRDHTKWSEDDIKLMTESIKPLIGQVNFLSMAPNEYYDEVRPYRKLLPKQLRDQIKKKIMVPTRFEQSLLAQKRTKIFESQLIDLSVVPVIASWVDNRNEAYTLLDLPYTFKLIFRGSTAGFKDHKFFAACSLKSSTIIITKIKNQPYIMGAYNFHSWKKNPPKVSAKSFLFELPNGNSARGASVGRRKGTLPHRLQYGVGISLCSAFTISDQSWKSSYEDCHYDLRFRIKVGIIEDYEVFELINLDPSIFQ
ncbi:5106_t:CDS:2 [Paraglomus occultum]|uniref:5106_t:CDS:1 n=1 Tax=Paraglomus occultum TaxID=144539 RepID=A0A9N9FSB4_9GLOM|nr:5106_t:CDS:2 [Paraglomus occultum]